MNRRYLLSGVALFLFVVPALGGTSTITVKDASNANKVFDVVTDGSGNFVSESVICDQSAAAQCATVTAGNALKVDGSAAGISTWATGTLGAMANYGTSPGAVLVPGVNSFITNTPAVTQSGNWTARVVGNAGAIVDFAGQNASSPANSILMGAQFNTSPTTITSGNVSPLQLDNAGNLLVNIKAGAGSGGTALADEATFTQGTTNFTPTGCTYNTSITNLTAGQAGAFQCSNDRRLQTVSRLVGNAGANLDGATGSAVPANTIYLGVNNGGNLLGWPAKTANTVANTDVVPEVAVANALASVADNSDAVAVANPFGTPVVDHGYGFNGTSWDRLQVDGNKNLKVATQATELHLGEIGSNQIAVQVAQTVTASSAYASGNAVGGLMTVANAARVSGSLGASGTGGVLQNVAVNSKSVQTATMEVWIFNANPSGSTCTDKTAYVLATADFDKVVGVAQVPTTAANNSGWFSGGTGSVGQANNQAMAYDLSSATSLFACMVTRGTPTFTATSDISVKFNMIRS